MIDAPALRMSAANWVEAAIVVDAHQNPMAQVRFDDLIGALRLEIEPVTVERCTSKSRGVRRLWTGPSSGALNFGDCFAYALAKRRGEPLLFKGNDFAQTDIEPALKD